jgi:hypothetical protein
MLQVQARSIRTTHYVGAKLFSTALARTCTWASFSAANVEALSAVTARSPMFSASPARQLETWQQLASMFRPPPEAVLLPGRPDPEADSGGVVV